MLKNYLKYPTTPVADKRAIVEGDKYRFTVLTSRLIRVEYDEKGLFNDEATQVVVNRVFDVPNFTVEKKDGILYITTADVMLRYEIGKPFDEQTLSISYINENAAVHDTYYFGHKYPDNLGGTARTLDKINEGCPLEDGIMGFFASQIINDSKSLILDKDGWVKPRREGTVDTYVFNYALPVGHFYDYYNALKAFYKLTGKTPMIPRFALGNWWSRYWEYSEKEYLSLMDKFEKEDIPFSVGIIDMDWHYTKIPTDCGTGWTGYSWNKALFPNPKRFLNKLHKKGLKVSLNLHPAEGVGAHEDAYGEMAKAMGVDPASKKKIEFDIGSQDFLNKYFEILHHPLEEQGVDFWWMDWQQGTHTGIKGLDPLWMLNHFHYLDNGRDGKCPLMFSRYAGPGSHRYPLGFSGDSYITWDALKFQPYFTATAANIGYGWWSHDIGGHAHGIKDDELTARWVQFGLFSPILRLHSTKNPFCGKEPWNYRADAKESMERSLRLRHRLIPYLYTMNYRAHKFDEPIVRPLYYDWSYELVRDFKNEYIFGTEMIVSPIVDPADASTQMGMSDTYLPKGIWYDFYSGRRYTGGRTIKTFRDIYEEPVFVREGGIIPLSNNKGNDISNPKSLTIKAYYGKDNSFDLYESDDHGNSLITKTSLTGNAFIISKPVGDENVSPKSRSYKIELIGICNATGTKVTHNGRSKSATITKTKSSVIINVEGVTGELNITFAKVSIAKNDVIEWCKKIIQNMHFEYDDKIILFKILTSSQTTAQKLASIMDTDYPTEIKQALVEALVAE